MPAPLQPALIIGIGGSGIEIARRFRRRLHQDYPGATHVQCLGIDTDPQSQSRPDMPTLPDSEFHHAGNFAMAQYVGATAINNFPTIRAWWKSYSNLPFAFVAAGAGQRRPTGRLALFVHFDDIKSAITRQLQEIFQADSFNKLPPQYRRSMTVYIVASTCGGTGTGMFLDLAYVARQLIPQVMPQVMPRVRGLLLMPSAFAGTGRVPAGAHNALRANAFGALTELDWCMTKTIRREPVEYPTRSGPWRVSRDSLAFDSCFLLGNQDAQGAVYTSWPDLVERGSAHLQITLASALTQTGNSVLDNVESWMGSLSPVKGRSPMFSSMNADEIELPIARIHARWRKRFARQLAQQLEATVTRDQSGPTATELRRLEGTAGFGWLNRLVMKDELRAEVPALPQYAAAAQQADPDQPNAEQLIGNAHALESEAQRILERSQLGERVADAVRATRTELDIAVRQVLATGSIDDALALVRQVGERLEAMSAKTTEQRNKLPVDWLPAFGERLRNTKKGILQNKQGYARDLGTQAAQALGMSTLSWERNLWTRASQALNESASLPLLRAHLERSRDRLERLRALAQSAATIIQALPEPVVAAGMAAAISDADIDSAYDSPDRQERLKVFAKEHVGVLLDEEVPSAEGVAEALILISTKAVHTVANDFLAASEIRPDVIAARLDRLQPLAVFTPEWDALSQSGAASRPQRVALLGLPEEMAAREEQGREIIDRLQVQNRETTPVSIADNDQVLMMAQYHGFPLFALAEILECKRAFDADPSSRELRFTLPDQDARRWSVAPAEARESTKWFAVALALGRIKHDPILGGYVFHESGNGGGGERALARGEQQPERAREVARDEFLSQGLSDILQMSLGNELAGGSDALSSRLQQWVDRETERSADPNYPRSFLTDIDEVRLFAQSIRYN